jgi:hypothetical protein|tara:strand:- start:265 stop:807 length:543 start_codon:yes stop_codon:yes gene_type:complete
MRGDIPEVATVSELRELTGTSRQAIYRHIEKAGLEPKKGKKYVVDDVLAAIVENRKEDSRHISVMREEKVRLECEILQIKIDEERGRLIPVELIEKDWRKMVTACKARLLTLPSRLAPQIPNCEGVKEIERAIKSGVCESLMELTDEPYTVGEEHIPEVMGKDDQTMGTAVRPDGESMGK